MFENLPGTRPAPTNAPVRRVVGALLLLLTLVLPLIESCSREKVKSPKSDTDARIQYYSDRIVEHPTNYPIFALLAGAYLDKARQSHDPNYLATARTLLTRSLEIMPNFAALQMMAAVCNYAHRFQQGLEWGRQAQEACNSMDPSVTAMLVESYMGLGQYEEARKLLPAPGEKPTDYHTASALALWLASQRRYDEAVNAFVHAAEFARAEKATPLIVWTEVSAAGALLDSKRPGPARPHLDAAAKLAPEDINLRLHWAELMEAENQPEKAVAVYKTLLEAQEDPEVHRKAFLLARKMGQTAESKMHFEAAEKEFKRVIIAGEVYTLGSLARLYCDADVNLDQALALAEQNLAFKRDIEAQTTLTCVRDKLLQSTPAH